MLLESWTLLMSSYRFEDNVRRRVNRSIQQGPSQHLTLRSDPRPSGQGVVFPFPTLYSLAAHKLRENNSKRCHDHAGPCRRQDDHHRKVQCVP
eukprot:992813-Amphidinium_carterae.1